VAANPQTKPIDLGCECESAIPEVEDVEESHAANQQVISKLQQLMHT